MYSYRRNSDYTCTNCERTTDVMFSSPGAVVELCESCLGLPQDTFKPGRYGPGALEQRWQTWRSQFVRESGRDAPDPEKIAKYERFIDLFTAAQEKYKRLVPSVRSRKKLRSRKHKPLIEGVSKDLADAGLDKYAVIYDTPMGATLVMDTRKFDRPYNDIRHEVYHITRSHGYKRAYTPEAVGLSWEEVAGHLYACPIHRQIYKTPESCDVQTYADPNAPILAAIYGNTAEAGTCGAELVHITERDYERVCEKMFWFFEPRFISKRRRNPGFRSNPVGDWQFAWHCPSPPDLSDWQDKTSEDLDEYLTIIDYIDEHAEDMDFDEFLAEVGVQDFLETSYAGLDDDMIDIIRDQEDKGWLHFGFFRSNYPDGTPVIYHNHSGIEHVWEPRIITSL